MAELIRSFTKRAVEILSPNQINTFGIQTHPESYQSEQYKRWLSLCKTNKTSELLAEMTSYLQSATSIKSIADLGSETTGAVIKFLSYGKQVTKEQTYASITESRLDTLFEKQRSLFTINRMALADTILCLTHLKNLSHPSNIDYVSVFKTITFLERCIVFKMKLPELQIINYFNKPVLLPSCFSKMDACEPKTIHSPFSFFENPKTKKQTEHAKEEKNSECNCKLNDACVDQGFCCVKPRIDLVDLMMVKDHTKCYQAGDLSYIKNVLEGELLTTDHRRLERTEESIETEEEVRTFEEKYLQTEEKASLQKETEKILKQDSAFDAGVTASADWGTYKLDAQTSYSNNLSKSQTNKDIINSSKDVISRATKQMEEKIKKTVSSKRIFETEEKNNHTFNNSSGLNISGQYLYVNKISRAQVYNYGKKAVIDIILPEPASLYKRFFEGKFEGKAPDKPLLSAPEPSTIISENYISIANQYGLKDVEAPPELTKILVTRINGEIDKKHADQYNQRDGISVSIPENYETASMDWSISSFNWNDDGKTSMGLTLGGIMLVHSWGGSSNSQANLPALEGVQPLAFYVWGVRDYDLMLTVHCKLKGDKLLEWQMGVYAKIIEANEVKLAKYEKELSIYLNAKEEFETKEAELKKQRYNKNPFINREIEKEELKRMFISYISCQFYDQFDAMKNRVKPCGYPEMNIREAEQEGKFIQFFEQAFNWNLITYIFYPYFWGRKSTWKDKHMDESTDLIFEKFLAAGSCRVMVPIRDGFFDYVSYFIEYGEIWGKTGNPPAPNDPHYVSLAQEIKEQKQNFNVDREGSIDATNGSNEVILNYSDYYWDFGSPAVAAIPASVGPPATPAIAAIPAVPANINQLNIDSDLDREIILDCKIYRIVDIRLSDITAATVSSWIITLDRNYEGITKTNMKWSTGSVFIGAPWEFTTPTTLTFLRDKSSCLPCYPLKECKEQ